MQVRRGVRHPNWFLPIVLLAMTGCGSLNTSTSSPTRSALPKTGEANIKIPAGDRFLPFVTEVTRGMTITVHNGDTDAHTVTSTPGDPSSFDVRIEPGATVTLTLTVPGSYRYYCSIHATYDPQTDQIAADHNADHPDEPMAGVLVVA